MKLLTEEYKELLAYEHANTPGRWGTTAEMYVDTIISHAEGVTDWLDYGAGSGGLRMALNSRHADKGITVTEYEPSRPDQQQPPSKPFVACIDVLEHVEPDYIDAVLEDLHRVTDNIGYFTISCRLAAKTLKDGRNAHVLVKPAEWWKNKLTKHFEILSESYDVSDENYRVKVRSK